MQNIGVRQERNTTRLGAYPCNRATGALFVNIIPYWCLYLASSETRWRSVVWRVAKLQGDPAVEWRATRRLVFILVTVFASVRERQPDVSWPGDPLAF